MRRHDWQGDDGSQCIEAMLDQRLLETTGAARDEIDPLFAAALFRFLVERYHRDLTTSLHPLLRSREAAEDVVQETWIALYQRMQGQSLPWLKQVRILPWLKSIATKRAYTYQRKYPSPLSLDIDETAPLFEPPISSSQYPEQIVMCESIGNVLRATMKTLPPQEYQVLFLRFFGDRSLKEISQELTIPVNTVKSHLRRGLQHLRERLVEQRITNGDLDFWEPVWESRPLVVLKE